jgi:hypothetical protein
MSTNFIGAEAGMSHVGDVHLETQRVESLCGNSDLPFGTTLAERAVH